MGQLMAILLLITLTPNGSKIHHVMEFSAPYKERTEAIQSCEMNAAIRNGMLDVTKQIFICRHTRIFPEGTEHL